MPIVAAVRGVEALERGTILGIVFRWSQLRLTLSEPTRWRRAEVHLERRRDGTIEAVGTTRREDGTSSTERWVVT